MTRQLKNKFFYIPKHNNNTFKGMISGVFKSNLSEDKIVDRMEGRRKYRERKNKEIRPYTEVERTLCPYHGFNAARGMMLFDSEGSQCALKAGSYSLCEMEIAGNKPNWSECRFNTEENRKYIEENSEKIRVFPREFRPPKIKSWKGISLMSWVKYITDGVPIKE